MGLTEVELVSVGQYVFGVAEMLGNNPLAYLIQLLGTVHSPWLWPFPSPKPAMAE